MYKYDQYDQQIVDERVSQFRDQTERFLKGELHADHFKPLRLQNGLYIQRHAPMLRVAIPYGLLSSKQLVALADIADKYDRGYGHFTTRQNIQYNWLKLEEVPDLLADLAKVEMHAIQTSGNCVRNVTTDQFAGVAADEWVDPRPYCEILRQWSTFHPEFHALPRKFKIAVNGSREDRAAVSVHDIGVYLKRDPQGNVVVDVLAGGGLGRTPIVGTIIKDNLPWQHLLSYIEAILRVYNRYGRRDNLYKARIKILVKALGGEAFAEQVEAEWQAMLQQQGQELTLTQVELDRVAAHFTDPAYLDLAKAQTGLITIGENDASFQRWVKRSTFAHKRAGYTAVTLSLKRSGIAPGDLSSELMRKVAALADRYSFSELRVTHEQNLVLADVERRELWALWQELKPLGLAQPNVGLITDIVACPGGDYCSLANAKSIPIAQDLMNRFESLDYQFDLGPLDLNISGCMNSCAHHHVSAIGILGVDKDGSEWYQVSLGGKQGKSAAIGKVIGPSFAASDVGAAIETIVKTYVAQRDGDELFSDVVDRVGIAPFKEAVYGKSKSEVRETADVV
jgi:sulfite reductase (NADPH) hemoprotein beta-component